MFVFLKNFICKRLSNDFKESCVMFYRLFIEYVKKYIAYIVISIVLMIVVALTTSGIAYIVGPTINKVFVGKQQSLLFLTCVGLVLLYFVKSSCAYVQSVLLQKITTRIITDIQVVAFGKIIRMPMKDFDQTESGKIITTFLHDIQKVGESIEELFVTSVRDLATVFFLVCLVFWNNWMLAVVAFCIYPLIFVPLQKIKKAIKNMYIDGENYLQSMSARLSDVVNGIKTIKSYNTEQVETHKMTKLLIVITRIALKISRRKNAASPAMEFASGLSIALILFVGGLQIVYGYSDVGRFFSFFTALIMAHRPARSLFGLGVKLTFCQVSLKRVFSFIDNIQTEQLNQGVMPNLTNVDIEFKNVNFNYAVQNRKQTDNNECVILKNINFKIRPKQKVAFVGISGSGKSTIISLLMRLYDCSDGFIYLDGIDVKEIALSHLRKNIAYIGQDNFLFDDSIRNNILYGSDCKNITNDVIDKAIKEAQVNFLSDLSNGIYENVGYNGSRFSFGQQQRIAIARALIKNAPIVVFDEATSALDAETEKAIRDVIFTEMQDKTVIIIAHRLSTIVGCDNIFVMDKGEIVEQGTHTQLLHNPVVGLYKRLWESLNSSV